CTGEINLSVQAVYVFLAALVAAGLVGILVAILMRRAAPTSASSADADRLRTLEAEVVTLRDGKADAERRLAAEERTAARVPGLEGELAERTTQMESLREAKAAVEAQLARATENASRTTEGLGEAQRTLEAEQAKREEAVRTAAELSRELATTKERLEQE